MGKKIKVEGYKGVFRRAIPALSKKENDKGSNDIDYMFYIAYRRGGRDGQRFDEPVGKASEGMTAAKASNIRALRIQGKELSNVEKRQAEREKQEEKKSQKYLNEIWEVYAKEYAHRSCIRADANRYDKHIRKLLGNKLVIEITREDIQSLRKKAESKSLSDQSIKHIVTLVRRVLNFANNNNICKIPSDLKYIVPKVDNQVTEKMDYEQLTAYLKALDEEPNQKAVAFLRLALFTGIRKGALLGLRWNDIDFNNNMLTLRAENAKNNKTCQIPLNQVAIDVLNFIRPENEKIKQSDNYIFPGKNGEKRKDYRWFARKIKKKAGLPADFRPVHGLRHSFASLLINSGQVTLHEIQGLLTHSSQKMTERYAHLFDDRLKRATNIIDGVIENNI